MNHRELVDQLLQQKLALLKLSLVLVNSLICVTYNNISTGEFILFSEKAAFQIEKNCETRVKVLVTKMKNNGIW